MKKENLEKTTPEELVSQARTLYENTVNAMLISTSFYSANYMFYAFILARCKINISFTEVPTLGVGFNLNSYYLYINPLFFNTLSLEERLGVLKHEALHLCNGHSYRRTKFNLEHERYNIAADIAINQQIEDTHLPAEAIRIENFFTLDREMEIEQNAEYYYDKLKREELSNNDIDKDNSINKNTNKSDNKEDSKEDNKSNSKSNSKSDNKEDSKEDNKSNSKSNSKSDNKEDSKSDNKEDSKSDNKEDSKSNSKSDNKEDSKSNSKSDNKEDSKSDNSTMDNSNNTINTNNDNNSNDINKNSNNTSNSEDNNKSDNSTNENSNNNFNKNIKDKKLCIGDHSKWSTDLDDIEHQEAILTEMVEKAVESVINSGRGILPKNHKEMLKLLKERKQISWQNVLRKIAGNKRIGIKKTYLRRNRRFPERVDIKGCLKDRKFNLLVIADVSGSVSNKDLLSLLAEIRHICALTNSAVDLIQIDTTPSLPEKLKPNTTVINRKSCGGTLLFPAIAKAKEHKIEFNGVLVTTDGFLDNEDINNFHSLNLPIIWLISSTGDVSNNMNTKKMKAFKLTQKGIK